MRKAGDRQSPVAGATRMNATNARLERGHEILRGFCDSNWIAGGESWIPVRRTPYRTEVGYALHVLNHNNPNLHRGWIRKHYPWGRRPCGWRFPVRPKSGP